MQSVLIYYVVLYVLYMQSVLTMQCFICKVSLLSTLRCYSSSDFGCPSVSIFHMAIPANICGLKHGIYLLALPGIVLSEEQPKSLLEVLLLAWLVLYLQSVLNCYFTSPQYAIAQAGCSSCRTRTSPRLPYTSRSTMSCTRCNKVIRRLSIVTARYIGA